MNEYLKEFIILKENYKLQDGNKSTVLALYEFADRLSVINENEAKEVLVDVYCLLGMMESAYNLFSTISNKGDRKQIKKAAYLQELSKSHGDKFALPRPLGEKEEAARRERLKDLPKFRYYPDPLGTGAFKEGEAKTCPCCGKKIQFIILPCPIVLKMCHIFVLYVFRAVKLQKNMMPPLFRIPSGKVSLIKKRMKSFFAVLRDI